MKTCILNRFNKPLMKEIAFLCDFTSGCVHFSKFMFLNASGHTYLCFKSAKPQTSQGEFITYHLRPLVFHTSVNDTIILHHSTPKLSHSLFFLSSPIQNFQYGKFWRTLTFEKQVERKYMTEPQRSVLKCRKFESYLKAQVII